MQTRYGRVFFPEQKSPSCLTVANIRAIFLKKCTVSCLNEIGKNIRIVASDAAYLLAGAGEKEISNKKVCSRERIGMPLKSSKL